MDTDKDEEWLIEFRESMRIAILKWTKDFANEMVVSYPMEFYKHVRDSGLSSASQMIDSWSGELVKGVNPAKDEAVSIFYEALVDEFLDLSVRLQLSTFDTVALMKILAIANYFPEIYLPLSFILDTVHIWDVSKKLLCSKNRVSDVGAPTNVGNVP
ncbi:unnamed protein product [Caenorhabditis nigoni]